MVAYFVRWTLRADAKPRIGRKKIEHSHFDCTVLCNNYKDAVSCLEILWHDFFNKERLYDIVDGDISCQRMKIDSRGFHIQWLFKDSMKEPFYLVDPNKSIFHLSKTKYF